jgi:hypothetical protein
METADTELVNTGARLYIVLSVCAGIAVGISTREKSALDPQEWRETDAFCRRNSMREVK